MAVDIQDFFTRCPYCRTMFRVGSVVIEGNEAWVKCGRCDKVFDYKENQINPSAFAKQVTSSEAQSSNQALATPKTSDSGFAVDNPQTQFAVEQNKTANPITEVEKALNREKYFVKEQSVANQNLGLRQSQVTAPYPGSNSPAQASKKSASNEKADKKKSSNHTQLTKNIKAQSYKNQTELKSSYSTWIILIGLLALLIWQTAIVNYPRLKHYSFLNAPLNLVCTVFSCNPQQPLTQSEFEILHANLRRHRVQPAVMTISANLINYSNSDKPLPKVRLDLTSASESIVASRIVNLVETPHVLDPAISQLAPGQDVKITFDVDRPPKSAVGFELHIVD